MLAVGCLPGMVGGCGGGGPTLELVAVTPHTLDYQGGDVAVQVRASTADPLSVTGSATYSNGGADAFALTSAGGGAYNGSFTARGNPSTSDLIVTVTVSARHPSGNLVGEVTDTVTVSRASGPPAPPAI
jgi:hypothetical protein